MVEPTLANAPYWVLAYYFYTNIADAEDFAYYHLKYCKQLGIRGRIYVSHEGINGSISGTPAQCQVYMSDLKEDPRFEGTEFKIDPANEHAFTRMHCRYKNEIVHSGLRHLNPNLKTGKHLRGQEVQQMMQQDDVVLLDVRSNYETRLGRFKNAITLDIENFREFPEKVKELEHLKNKKVITYCTGGIKCEKASAYLLEQGFTDVYQMHNGIIGYANDTGGKDFEGVLYVFDGRVTVPINKVNPTLIAKCIKCGTPTDRNLNCANVYCNEQFNMCPDCSNKMEGCCSETCMNSDGKRPYNGTGFYAKPPVDEGCAI
ncbi:MAG: rhodanese-related sulfurtransferase [Bacteroidia bacterium]